ncbi:hypothetical protein G7054_g4545 [Neopestalotiopsis clavispora]|nr:hypothetical protein G7054_g4545 [Neopestalotiopsis clavispora]
MTNNPQSNAQDSSSGISQVADQRDCRRRKAHHKVKTGCQSCKTRRQKCDERRPVCSGCERHSTTCIYQGKNRRSQPKSQAQTASSLESIDDDTLEASQILDFGSLRRAPPELNLVDLELMHQYLMSTCSIAVGQRPEMIAYHQMKMPRLGQAYPFVMRGILAMAATHLSWLKPSQQAHYAMIAARNHHAALPEFRSCLQDINKQNCYALVAYAKSILWCSFSGFRSSHSYKIGQNWFPEWFRLMHGSCHLVEISKPWIKEGPHVHQEVESTVDTSSSLPDDHRLSILMSRLSHLTFRVIAMQSCPYNAPGCLCKGLCAPSEHAGEECYELLGGQCT